MPGLGGRELSKDHVTETARLITKINPTFVRFRTYCPIPGTPGWDALKADDFEPLSEREHVQEIHDMIEGIGDGCTSTVATGAETKVPGCSASSTRVEDRLLQTPSSVVDFHTGHHGGPHWKLSSFRGQAPG